MTERLALRFSAVMVALLMSWGAAAACGVPASSPGRATPSRDSATEGRGLVVLIVVDQLGYELLHRYEGAYSGGFARLLREGRRFERATHDHSETETAPGHATLTTGTHPSRHGVVGNIWLEEENGQWVPIENMVDPDFPLLGEPTLAGASPGRLERGGLADWILASSPEARIVSLSAKDRSAVLLASHARGDVYWYDAPLGRFVTSVYYRSEYPSWLAEFNRERLPVFLADSVLDSSIPDSLLGLAPPDSMPYEADGVHTAFPHTPGERGVDAQIWLTFGSGLDRATLELAQRATTNLELGLGERVDLLALGLSQTDRVGHEFGPGSREQFDNLLRLDRELGAFLGFLEEHLRGRPYVLALTADHGSMDAPERREAEGRPGRRLGPDERRALTEVGGRVLRAHPAAPEEPLRDSVASFDWVDDAWVTTQPPADSFGILIRNGTYPGRITGPIARFGVQFRLTEGTLDWTTPQGSAHDMPYLFNRHVPLIFLGPGIEAGLETRSVGAVDVAPTLARWMGIPYPDDLDGHALLPGR